MEEVTITLQGGLGNYMFQIAAAHAYGLKHNKKPILTTGDSVVIHKPLDTYRENILYNVQFSDKKSGDFITYNELGFHYNEIPKIEGSVLLNGYFQSEKYFNEFSSEIKQLFSYPENISNEILNKLTEKGVSSNKNTCSIHVRRGDYLNSPNHHPAQNMNFYMKAIKKMPKDTMFFIFSDDIEWCKANFPDVPEKFVFIEGGKDYEDLKMMSLCKNNIICNSTFSWWAAWLNENTDKLVVVPDKWFGPAYAGYNTSDLYCENWIRI